MRGKSVRYLIGVCVFLCCVATVGHAIDQNRVLNATVFIETEISNGSGFYVGPDLIATNLHIISEAENIRVFSDERDLGFNGVVAYDAGRNLALLRVKEKGTYLDLSQAYGPQSSEEIYTAASTSRSRSGKHFRNSYTRAHTSRDFCRAGVKFPVDVEVNSDGGAVVNGSTKVIGVFYIGIFKYEHKLRELNYSFVVPVEFLRDLMNGPLRVKVTPIKAELDYCALISRANARARKANRFGIGWLRNIAKIDVRRGLERFGKLRKIPVDEIIDIVKFIF